MFYYLYFLVDKFFKNIVGVGFGVGYVEYIWKNPRKNRKIPNLDNFKK